MPKADRDIVMDRCLKADAMLQEIVSIVSAWDETLSDAEVRIRFKKFSTYS